MSEAARRLLAWYDANARALPWRAPPGAPPPEPYRVWLSEIMLQQTVAETVKPYFRRFLELWPDVAALAAAPRDEVLREWAGLGYYARARNLHACAEAVAANGGRFPDTIEGLRALPGVGPYTAAAIAAIAFGRPVAAVDGNVERVVARLAAIEAPLPAAKPLIQAAAEALVPADRPGDFAQAQMDLGSALCLPRAPRCAPCPLATLCEARARGIEAELPRKAAKKPKPARRGVAFALFREDGALLVETRPEKGLLGGMIGLPGSDWAEAPAEPAPPAAASWRTAGTVSHVFTHFTLELEVRVAIGAARGRFLPFAEARAAAPTVMRKAMDAARAALSGP